MVTIHTLWRLTVIVWTRMQQGRCVQVWVPFPKLIFSRSELCPLQRGALYIPAAEQNAPSQARTEALNQSASKWHQVPGALWEKRGEGAVSAFHLSFSGAAKPRLTSQPPDGGQTTLTHSHTNFASQQYRDERKAKRDVDTLTPCLPRFYLSLSINAVFMSLARSLCVFLSRSLFSLL